MPARFHRISSAMGDFQTSAYGFPILSEVVAQSAAYALVVHMDLMELSEIRVLKLVAAGTERSPLALGFRGVPQGGKINPVTTMTGTASKSVFGRRHSVVKRHVTIGNQKVYSTLQRPSHLVCPHREGFLNVAGLPEDSSI